MLTSMFVIGEVGIAEDENFGLLEKGQTSYEFASGYIVLASA